MEQLRGGPWETDQRGRQIRIIEIKGVLYHQWHHVKGPIKPFGQQLTDAEDPTIPRYQPGQNFGNSRPAALPTRPGPQPDQPPTQRPAIGTADYSRHTSSINADHSRVLVTGFPYQTSQNVPYTLFPKNDDGDDDDNEDDHATLAPTPTPPYYALSTAQRSDGQPQPLDHRHVEHQHTYLTMGDGALGSTESAKGREPTRSSSATTTHNATIDSGQSKAIEAVESRLSKRGYEFLKLKYTDYVACENFIKAYPEILQEDHNLFVHEAVRAHKANKASQARICIQQSLILRMCSGLSVSDIPHLFDRLLSKDKKNEVLVQFFKDFDKISRHVKDVAERDLGKKDAGRKIARSRDGKVVYMGENRDILRPAATRRASETSASRPSNVTLAELSKHSISSSAPMQSQFSDQGAQRKSSKPPPPIERTDSARRSTLSSVDENGSTYEPSIVPEIRGAPPEREVLDEKYQKRRDAKKFFEIGRVFALLWHEGVGENKPGNRPNPDLSDHKNATRGRFGQDIFSHIRRMVVVKERKGYCWCIPINTYNGKGVAKPGMSPEEREAHTIVHESLCAPRSHPNEQNMMTKQPIAIDMSKPDQRLDVMSRLNFAKVHTVEWNVKVMDVGKVAEKSMVYFITYWNNEKAA